MRTDQPHGLHRDGGRPGDSPPVEEVLQGRAENAERTYPAMLPERPVLGRHERLDDPVVGIGRIVRTAVHVVLAQGYAQHLPTRVAQHHSAGIVAGPLVRPADAEPRRAKRRHGRARKDAACHQQPFRGLSHSQSHKLFAPTPEILRDFSVGGKCFRNPRENMVE